MNKRNIIVVLLAFSTPALAQQQPVVPPGDKYIFDQLAAAQRDVQQLANYNATLRGWIETCVKDFKKCEEEHKKNTPPDQATEGKK